jgi:hypothetical protein
MVVDLPHDYSIMDLPGEDRPVQIGPFSRKSPGNANPKDMTSVNRLQIQTYKGRAQAIIRPSGTGNVKLMAESQGLKTGELKIQVTE